MKQIFINARFLLQRPTGVERYAYEMCRAIVQSGTDVTLVCPASGDILADYDCSGFHIVRFGVGNSHLWEQLIFPFFFINRKDYLVLSFTGLGSILIRNKIMTIHDLSFLVNPSWFSKAYYYYYKVMTPLAARTSKAVITVSNFSKSEIIRYYRFLAPDHIHVIYNAADGSKFQRSAYTSDDEYYLAVSSMDPRKNFDRLIQAFEGLESCRLKIVGGNNKVFSKSIGHAYSSNIDFLGRVSDQELVSLYSNSSAFIFPSLYEGFGLPTIEAMTTGCPVLASDIPVLREICGSAVLYFDPMDVQSIRRSILYFHNNRKELSDRMKADGITNANRFSWEKSARELLKILKTY